MLFATRQNIYRNAISSPMRRLLSICALILCACQSPAAIEPMISGSSVEDDQIYAADDLSFYTAMNDANTPEHGKAPALRDEKCALLGESFAQAATIGAAYGAQSRLGNAGMPKNARQTTEGYWVGAQPMPSEIDELHARNIRVVVTAAAMESDTFRAIKSKLDDHGIRHINIPFGGRFPNPKAFYQTIHAYTPDQIYIHCEHGGDRSGAILAYLLVVDHGWTIPRALLAVAFPGKNDSKRLIELLKTRGFDVSQPDIDDYLGIYSAETNGGYGGLKVRSAGYVKLINTTIDAALRELKHKM